jgi:CMP-N-acetylneuraminic acid synthetase
MKIITICARGGSVGLPGKNVRLLCGKPLIAWTIDQALTSCVADRVYVSTDSEEIARVASDFGARVPFLRPSLLATATVGKVAVIRHLVEWVEVHEAPVRRVIDLDPTSPLRDIADIQVCDAMLDEQTDLVITGYESDKNPYFNMVELKPNGFYERVCKPDIEALGRQTAPTVYAMNASIYAWHRASLHPSLWDAPRIRLHAMPRERSIDIDHLIDFELVERLMKKKVRT